MTTRLKWLVVFLLLSAFSAAGEESFFDVKPVVEGVYAAVPRHGHEENCNAAIILLDDGVMVVDTHLKPSAARSLVAEIKKITEKPVKYVVDTHFHADHYQGNQVYTTAWPKTVEIISSEATRESLELRGIPRVRNELVTVPRNIEKLKADLAKATEAKQTAAIEGNLRQSEDYLAEIKTLQVTLPTMTFDQSLIIHRPSRTVEVLWFGKAHTDGDVVAYLPKERVIATGDVLHNWTPYMGDSYPYDWIKTLDAAEKLDFDYVIGGHGDVLRGKSQFELWKSYLSDLMAETAAAYADGATLAEARRRVATALGPKYASKFPPTFPEDVVGNVEKAYRVVSGLTE